MIENITNIPAELNTRINTTREFDAFLGGGFIPSQCIMIAGQPGAGKSTLLLQLATILADQDKKILYFSGEESLGQIRLRADRLKTLRPEIFCSDQIKLEEIIDIATKQRPDFIVIDSIQMVYSDEISGEQGTPKQIKAGLLRLIKFCKDNSIVLIAIGHSTKSGLIAGMLTLQHMVDSVFFLKKDEEGNRFLVANKNRFGNVDEIFPLTMNASGFTQFPIPEMNPVHEVGGSLHINKEQALKSFETGLSRFFFKVGMGTLERLKFGKEAKDYDIIFRF